MTEAGPNPRFLDWLAARLKEAGLARAFGVPGGGSSLDLMLALKEIGIETVLTAREDAAVMMAGVTGTLAEAPGLAFTTKGPGLASASNGLASAALDRMPALLLPEAFEADELDYVSHQVFDQAALVAPLLSAGRAGVLAADAATVAAWLRETARSLRAPAVLFATASDWGRAVQAPEPAPEVPVPIDAAALAEARALLTASRRPVVVVGLEAARPALAQAVRDFVAALGAPALVTYMAKGTVADDDACFAGIFTGGAVERACVEDADLIVLVGLDPVELIRQPWPYRAPVLDLAEVVHAPHYVTPAARLMGPLAETLAALGQGLAGSDWSAGAIARHRQHFHAAMENRGGGLGPSEVVRAAAEVFEARPRLAVDAGAHMFSACATWPAAAPRDFLISNGLATMSFALPAAIAAALHEPERGAVAIAGDGGLMMCLGELKTAAECGAKVTVLVFNDGRLSLIDIKREQRQMPDLGLAWQTPDFAAVARGFGLEAWRAENAAELQAALANAAAAAGPTLIDARVDAGGYPDQIKALRG
jgi:acetolactate synthase-1/2/3 large subunit